MNLALRQRANIVCSKESEGRSEGLQGGASRVFDRSRLADVLPFVVTFHVVFNLLHLEEIRLVQEVASILGLVEDEWIPFLFLIHPEWFL